MLLGDGLPAGLSEADLVMRDIRLGVGRSIVLVRCSIDVILRLDQSGLAPWRERLDSLTNSLLR